MANSSFSGGSRRNESVDFIRDHPKRTPVKGSSGASVRSSSTGRSTASAKSSARSTARKTGTTRRTSKKKKKQRRILLFAVLFLLFSILALIGTILIFAKQSGSESCTAAVSPTPATNVSLPASDSTVISQNVTVNGISLQGLTVSDARTRIQNRLNDQMQSMNIRVAYTEYAITLTAEKIGMHVDDEAIEQALLSAASATSKTELTVLPVHNDAMLKEALSELNDQLPNHAVNARCELQYRENKVDGTIYYQPYFSYTPGINGMAVDSEDVLQKVNQALDTGNYTAEIRPEVTVSEPAITEQMWRQRTTLLAEMTTSYRFRGTSEMDEQTKLNCQNRDINISKAVVKMNYIELAPGKQFSYNKATGSRTEKNGWALANAIYQGTHRPEAGGGVCQLSTTMYNALLLANVRIDSRRAHSMPVDYVEDGWDATVDDGHIDFKFTNNTDDTLYIFCYITKNKNSTRRKDIHVEVYGTAFPEGVTYKKRTELVEILPFNEEVVKDRTMFVSDKEIVEREGKNGSIVKTFIDEYVNGTLSRTVYTTTTTYEPIHRKIRIGTKADPTEPPMPTVEPSE